MGRAARLNEVIAKHDAPAGAEPAVDAAGEASQTDGGVSTEGSAAADATSTGGSSAASPADEASTASPAAPITEPQETAPAPAEPDENELRAKLERDRERRAIVADKRRAREEREAAEASRKEADAAREKWASLGKDGSIVDTLREAGRDPREVFEKMRDEAIKAGTPEAQIAKIQKSYDAELAKVREETAALKAKLEAQEKAAEDARAAAEQAAFEQEFADDFRSEVKGEAFRSLLSEYEEPILYGFVSAMRDDPNRLLTQAERLGVRLTADPGHFNMRDILTVLAATQADHEARKQRRNQTAAPQSSQPGSQRDEAKKPTVNGTEARNAGTTIGNDLAASSAGAPPDYSNESHKERMRRLVAKYG